MVGGYTAATYGPAVAGGAAAAYTAGQNALSRLMAMQPGNIILDYPNTPPLRLTIAQLLASMQPYMGQFISGALPSPGGPFKSWMEALTWSIGWGSAYLYDIFPSCK